MVPSKNWFPMSLQERAAWYDNFNAQIQGLGAALGLSGVELDTIKDDNSVLQFLAVAAVTVKAYTAALRNYRKIITEDDVGDNKPDFPANMGLALPAEIQTGMFERLDTYVVRIRASAGYTAEIGALLGIIPIHTVPLAPEMMKPVIKGGVMIGNIVNVKFVKGTTDGVRVEAAIDNGAWTNQGNFVKSPAVLEIPQNADQLPRSVKIRARFLDGNSPIGIASDIVTVQTIP